MHYLARFARNLQNFCKLCRTDQPGMILEAQKAQFVASHKAMYTLRGACLMFGNFLVPFLENS